MLRRPLILTGLVALPAAAAGADLPEGAFGWMAELAGHCWTAVHADGTRDTQCYSTQYDRYLRGTIEIVAGGESARPPYLGDSVFVWNPERSEMQFHYWGSGGNVGVSTGIVQGEQILFPSPPSTDPNAPARRSVWTRLGPTSFRVTLQRQAGESWEDTMSVTYNRAPPADATRR